MKRETGKLHQLTFSLAIIGLLITISGNFYHVDIYTSLSYLVGALILLVSAAVEKNVFFSVLEIILSIGAAIAFFQLSPVIKTTIPVGLGVLAALYFALSGELKDYLTWLSIFGVIIITIGYAIVNPLICMFGGIVVAIYSFCSFSRGEKIALIFGILNTIFVITAFLEVIKVL